VTGPTTLTALSSAELRVLRDKIASGALGLPVTQAGLQAAGLGDRGWLVDVLAPFNQASAVTVLDLVDAERRRGDRIGLDLVWTGPEAAASTARDTAVVMRSMFAQARDRVLVAGYAFDTGGALFEPLHRAMLERGVRVQMFLNIPRARKGTECDQHARAFLQQHLMKNWPWQDVAYPEFYFDPRTAQQDSVESLHAKCVVVDNHLALIGSANFTDRGQTRNIEIGVLVDDADFGTEVTAQWQGLVSCGLVRRIVP
jgi:phosphatidylserine/phosphatidylglycerophosphate/cardiolipin synthase-like enzyme